MQNDLVLVIGDKVDITTDGRHFYKTSIGDIYNDGLVLIGPPIYRRTQMELHLADEIYLVFYRESGRYITQMRVVDFETKDEVRYALLEQLIIPERDQRREVYRLPVGVETLLCEYTDGIELTLGMRDDVPDANVLTEARTRDISVTGASLLTTRECYLGERYLLKMYLEGSRGKNAPFIICATVMRLETSLRAGMYEVGMRFIGITKSQNEYLSKYVLRQQQHMIVKRRLIEGD